MNQSGKKPTERVNELLCNHMFHSNFSAAQSCFFKSVQLYCRSFIWCLDVARWSKPSHRFTVNRIVSILTHTKSVDRVQQNYNHDL